MSAEHVYGELGGLFAYPGDDYPVRVARCVAGMRSRQAEAAKLLEEFQAAIQDLGVEELEELYTRTFDLNPLCTLEIGWQLYGEDYQRGEFLVKMRQQLRAHGLRESGELPDHLTHALFLLSKLEPDEAGEFAGSYLLPALDKMRAAWREDRNAFACLVEATFKLLASRYSYIPAPVLAQAKELPVLQ